MCCAYLAKLIADLHEGFWVHISQLKSVFGLKVKFDFTAKTPALNHVRRKVVIYEAVNFQGEGKQWCCYSTGERGKAR